MIQEKKKLSGTLNSKQFLNGTLSNSVIYVDPITQEKTVIPTAEQQIVTPDEEYTGLSKVTIEAIQDENLISENIRNGVDILGVTGNYVGSKYAPRYISFSNYSRAELDEELANLDTRNIENMNYMFNQCAAIKSLDLSNFNTSNSTDFSYMFSNCINLQTLNISSFDVSKANSIRSMFYNCRNLTSLDLSNFNTSNVIYMDSVFSNCQSLTSLDLSNFNTSKANGMSSMFSTCKKLTSLDLSNFDTSNVTDMSSMLNYCENLQTLNISSFDTSNVSSVSNMFNYCKNLTNIPTINGNKLRSVAYMVNNCVSLTTFGGVQNLGKNYLTSSSANYNDYKLNLSTCTALTEQSLINVLTNLYDIATRGCKTQQVILGSTNLAKLTSEEGQSALAQATAYGWTIS
ncbi:MAG: BspA family leucine-rich repeat surface protein [Candidatus Onthovivens sp.]|nr:BspA family leucine-rich repeat surface protein [Candidatus Onthovivens sp.]